MPLARARIDRVEGPNDNGWYRIHCSEGPHDSYDTKDLNRAKEAAALRGRFAEIDFSENPVTKFNEKLGRSVTYPNRYYEHAIDSARQDSFGGGGIDPVGGANGSTAIDTPKGEERGYGWKTNPDDAWRMALSTGAKMAIETLPMLPEGQRSFEHQQKIALAWARFIFFTAPPTTSEIMNQVEDSFREPAFASGPADDDIPF